LDRLLVDTGFLVAYAKKHDFLHAKADRFLSKYRGALYSVSAVIVETCFHLDSVAKQHLLEWVKEGSLAVVEVPVSAYAELAGTIGKYSDHDVDFADAALLWLAEKSGIRKILTTDRRDFHVFRLKDGKRLDLIEWF
jgi:predicted nucleic acid-binding protein